MTRRVLLVANLTAISAIKGTLNMGVMGVMCCIGDSANEEHGRV